MSQQTDVQLTVGMTAEGVDATAEQLRAKIEGIFHANSGNTVSPAFQAVEAQMSRLYDRSIALEGALEAVRSTYKAKELGNVYEEMSKVSDAIDKQTQKIEDLKKSRAELATKTIKTDAYAELEAELSTLINQQKTAQTELDQATETYNSLGRNVRFVTGEVNNLITAYKTQQISGDEFVSESQRFRDVMNQLTWQISMTESKMRSEEKTIADLGSQIKSTTKLMEEMTAAGTAYRTLSRDEYSYQDKKARGEIVLAENELRRLKEQNVNLSNQENEISEQIYNKEMEILGARTQVNNQMSIAVRKATEMNKLADTDEWKLLINTINQGPKAIIQFADTIATTLPPAVQVAYAVIKKLAEVIIDAFSKAWDIVADAVKNVFVKAVNAATTAVKSLSKALLQLTGRAMFSPILRLADSIKNLKKQADNSIPSLKQMGRAFIQYGLGARSLYFFVRKLRTALFEGFGDLAVAYQPFNDAMSQIMTSLSYLRNSFVAAFAPIIQYVAPVLNILISKLAQAVQMIGQFIAALTGKEFVMAMPVYQDYASTTKAGAAAAKEAAAAEKDAAKQEKNRAKALKEIQRTIAGFDDVEILKEPKDSNSGSGSSGSPSAGGSGGGLTFKAAPIESAVQKFADMLKKMWQTADFYDLGVLMGRKLGDLLRTFHDNVPKIESFLNRIAKSIATFLAGFLSVNDTFKVLGVAIADTINTVFSAINTFLSTFMALDGFKNLGKDIYYAVVNALANIDWSTIYTVFVTLGVGIAQTLNEVLTKPDLWEQIFQTLCNAIKAVVLRFYFFVLNLRWEDIGTAIGRGLLTAIENFPFDLMARSAATFITGIFTALGNMARKVESEGGWYRLGKNIGSAIMTFFNGVFTKENGRSLGVFVQGIFNTLKGIVATTDFDQIAQDVIDFISGFFDEFDWEENADTILHVVNTLLNKFIEFTRSEQWENIVKEIWTYITTSPEVKEFLGNLWDSIEIIAKAQLLLAMPKILKLGAMIALGILKGIILTPAYVANWVREHVFTPIWNKIKSVFGIESPAKKMKPLGEYVIAGFLQGIIDKLKGIGAWVKDHIFSPFKNGLDGAFGIAGGVAEKIKSIGKSVISGFKKGAEEQEGDLNTKVKKINTDTQSSLEAGNWRGIGSKAMNSVKGGIDSVKGSIHTLAQNINASMFKALEAGQWRTIGTKAITAVRDGMNSIRPYVLQTAQNIQSSLYNAFSSGNWYKIGDNIIEGIWSGLKGGWNWLYNKVWNLAVDLYNAAMRALGIHSPSKVFAEKVGEMIPAGIGMGITDNESAATTPIEDMADNLVETARKMQIPPIAMGKVIPTNSDTQTDDQTATLNSLLDVIQSLESDMVKRDELEEIIANIVRTYMNIDFYIGDEKLARHVNTGNSLLDRRFNPVASTR